METYTYGNVVLPDVISTSTPMPFRAEGVSTPARPGSRPPRALNADTRVITVEGVITLAPGENYDSLQEKWGDFVNGHSLASASGPGELRVRDGWIFYAFPESVNPTQTEVGSITYEVTYRCYDPFAYTEQVSTHYFYGGFPGNTIVTAYGRSDTPCAFVINVDNGTGSIALTNELTGKSFSVRVDSPGSYVIDAFRRTVTKDGARAEQLMTGSFVSLVGRPYGQDNNISIVRSNDQGQMISIPFAYAEWRGRTL